MKIRDYQPGDAPALAKLRYRSVRQLAPGLYSDAQIVAWQPDVECVHDTRARHGDGRRTYVAVTDGGTLMGVTDLDGDGHVDTLYVDPDFARRGVATALLAHVEAVARVDRLSRLYTEASEVARPVFEACGRTVTARREFTHRGVDIWNWGMQKTFEP